MGVHFDNNKLEIIETKTFHFHFDLPKDFDMNLKDEVDYTIKRNGGLSKQRIKNEIDKLWYKYKHANDINEHRKQ